MKVYHIVFDAARCLQETQVDIELVKTLWLSPCDKSHELCRASPSPTDTEDTFTLRLIDVTTNEVICSNGNHKYIALSYVWGQIKQWRAINKDHVRCARKHECGSEDGFVIQLDRSTLPRTIQDAMLLVETIGERYLWVDALCIVQDDEIELRNTLKHMNTIYRNAYLTIIDADGTNADSGLPGLRADSREITNIMDTVDGIPLIHAQPDLSLPNTPRAQRAWTFQEALFSQMWPVFCNKRMYFGCAEGAFPNKALFFH